MPYVLVQIVEGRSAEAKKAIAADITASLVEHAGARAEDCYVVFRDVAASDWLIAGETVAERRRKRGDAGT
ncbi:tautomerase family protein [Propylenella binzhouense]|uniref:4-oxalocrotonate tautomerase family protein n=1 Tax=Propylenella binzhouense TaxID=2555902 RepID=A0A964T488_9HYPH|nr:4-oxalocrotonate tautomerase family protein [Propylenella binzhouense]